MMQLVVCLFSLDAVHGLQPVFWVTYLAVGLFCPLGFDMAEKVVEIDNEPVRLQLW